MTDDIVEVDYDEIPDELKARRQWLLWDASADTPRRPHWDGNFYISWNDPNDWHSFEDAVECAEKHDSWGIGYVFSSVGPYTFIDCDGCLTTRGGPKDWLPALDPFIGETYIETSASGTGLHIILEDFEVPEWWRDCHFSEDEHEGVEVYEEKFCAFTGAPVERTSASTIGEIDATEWLIQAYKSVTEKDPLKDHAESLSGDSTSPSPTRDEFLDEESVREALEHIDPDVSYPVWRDIGFALKDFFGSNSTALSLFKDWSRGGTKWDSEAEGQAERIIKDATTGGGRTIGTVIHHARQGGWELPTAHRQSDGPASSVDLDQDEIERGQAILEMQTAPDDPVGENFVHKNGGYGIYWSYRDEDGNVTSSGVDPVCNFTLETLSYLRIEDQQHDEFKVRVHPSHPTEDPYDIRITPDVFNSAEDFRSNVVTGRTTWFDPSNRDTVRTVTILRYLRETVGAQPAPYRTGQPYIGLSDDGSEFVTPFGSLTADGWSDDPDYEYYSIGGENSDMGPFVQKWALNPDNDIDVDEDTVARICELLPNTRERDRGIPIYGWFYAAPLKTHIHQWEREFPILSPHGDTGSGKTSSLETFMKAFGGSGEPVSSTDTPFTKEKHLAESRGFPVWIDEYKPTEMTGRVTDHLHQRLKEVTKERMMPKGRPDLGIDQLHMRAPVILSGEQKINDAAVRRRSLLTNLSREATRDGTDTRKAFGELTGIAYEDDDGNQHYPDGYDLHHHARAYYEWALGKDPDELRAQWNDARDEMTSILESFGVSLEASEQRAIQTMIFGTALAHEFALAFGADEEMLPTSQDIRDACAHVIENIGKEGQRREHADEFLELMSLAATEGYLEHGVHHRLLESRSSDAEVLAIHMPSTFPQVRRYVRDSNLEEEYTLLSKTDYNNTFRNKASVPDSYVIDTNKRTKNIENGGRAVHFDHEAIRHKLGADFNIDAFRPPEERQQDDEGDVEPHEIEALAALDPGYHRELVAEVVAVSAGEYTREAQGTLKGPHGTYIDFVTPGGNENQLDGLKGEMVRLENVKLRRDEDDLLEAVINDAATVTAVGDSQATRLDDATESASQQPASDGGTVDTQPQQGEGDEQGDRPEDAPEATDGPPADAVDTRAHAQRAAEVLRDIAPATKMELVAQMGQRHDLDPETAKRAVEYARNEMNPALIMGPDDELEPAT